MSKERHTELVGVRLGLNDLDLLRKFMIENDLPTRSEGLRTLIRRAERYEKLKSETMEIANGLREGAKTNRSLGALLRKLENGGNFQVALVQLVLDLGERVETLERREAHRVKQHGPGNHSSN
ncbi:MAG: hypothetical protein LVQ95_03800 [Candidatus Micrarchaeales archaeon]|nr:hypothetical protein [Candidatus Micrarchaeales archaeon]